MAARPHWPARRALSAVATPTAGHLTAIATRCWVLLLRILRVAVGLWVAIALGIAAGLGVAAGLGISRALGITAVLGIPGTHGGWVLGIVIGWVAGGLGIAVALRIPRALWITIVLGIPGTHVGWVLRILLGLLLRELLGVLLEILLGIVHLRGGILLLHGALAWGHEHAAVRWHVGVLLWVEGRVVGVVAAELAVGATGRELAELILHAAGDVAQVAVRIEWHGDRSTGGVGRGGAALADWRSNRDAILAIFTPSSVGRSGKCRGREQGRGGDGENAFHGQVSLLREVFV